MKQMYRSNAIFFLQLLHLLGSVLFLLERQKEKSSCCSDLINTLVLHLPRFIAPLRWIPCAAESLVLRPPLTVRAYPFSTE